METLEEWMKRKTVCLDFDGVLFPYSKGWHDGTIYEPPTPEAVAAIQQLAGNYRLVISTCRVREFTGPDIPERIDAVRGYMDEHFDVAIAEISSQKPVASVYIDDRAVPFHPQHNNWDWVLARVDEICNGANAIEASPPPPILRWRYDGVGDRICDRCGGEVHAFNEGLICSHCGAQGGDPVTDKMVEAALDKFVEAFTNGVHLDDEDQARDFMRDVLERAEEAR
jgi:hypothetical protein